jgi:hypothetical protein
MAMSFKEEYSETFDSLDFKPNTDHLSELVQNYHGKPEKLKDELFYQVARDALIGDFFNELSDYLEPEDRDEFEGYLSEVSEEEFMSALSLPHQLRERWFQKFMDEIDAGTPARAVAKKYVDTLSKYKFDIGFHTSPNDIKPNRETGEWFIKGTEKDHRDNDRVMAFYSKQYRHLYKKDGSKYIYLVRTSPEDKTDGNWYRNDTLNIIMKIPLMDVIKIVELSARNVEPPDQQS